LAHGDHVPLILDIAWEHAVFRRRSLLSNVSLSGCHCGSGGSCCLSGGMTKMVGTTSSGQPSWKYATSVDAWSLTWREAAPE